MELLFMGNDSHSVSRSLLEQAKNAASLVRESELKLRPDEEIVATLVGKFTISLPEVDWERAAVSRQEAQLDSRHTPGVMAFHRQQTAMSLGEKVIVTVPFRGEREFFKIRPSSYTLNPPTATLERQALLFEYVGVQVDAVRSKQDFESRKGQIINCLKTLGSDFESFNAQLPGAIAPIIQEKRSRMEKGEGNLDSWGMPIS